MILPPVSVVACERCARVFSAGDMIVASYSVQAHGPEPRGHWCPGCYLPVNVSRLRALLSQLVLLLPYIADVRLDLLDDDAAPMASLVGDLLRTAQLRLVREADGRLLVRDLLA